MIRADHRGSGSSQRDVSRQGVDAWVEDVEAVVDAAELSRPFIVLGVSQAGAASGAHVARHPDRVSHLVSFGGGRNGARASGVPALIAYHEASVELMRVGWRGAFPGARILVTTGLIADATTEESAWFEQMLPRAMTMEDAVRFANAVADVDVRDVLPTIRTRTLVAHTAQDTANPPERGRKFAASIPGAQYVELPGKNHLLFPRDPGFHLFLKLLREFVADTDVPADPLACLSARERDILDAVTTATAGRAFADRGRSPV